MLILFYILSAVFILVSVLPLIPHQHWVFRVWEFGRIQLLILQLLMLTIGMFYIADKTPFIWGVLCCLIAVAVHNLIILIPYTPLYGRQSEADVVQDSHLVSILSINVYQFNEEYDKLIQLVLKVQPDILLTMESNQAWEDALSEIESLYPNQQKVALENTYGIHLYTKLDVESLQVHYFISDDLPSIEACLRTNDGVKFTFFGVHPPPPSPSEEDTSRERDGELLALGKRVLDTKTPVIVVGDFNNVAWAESSILFRKTSQLLDPRIGRGFVSTFHAKYRLLRFPIDLCFHSPNIFIKDFRALNTIGSDHLPLFCNFFINDKEDMKEDDVETLDAEEAEEVEEMIEDGLEENGDRPVVASE